MRRAFLLLAFSVLPVSAQTTLPADAIWFGTAGGAQIGTLKRGAAVRVGRAAGAYTMVTVDGWIASFRVTSRRDTLDRSVTGTGSAPIRAADGTTQPAVAEVEPGTLLKRLAERNGWTQVRRAGWVRTAALQVAAASPAGVAPTGSARGNTAPAREATSAPNPTSQTPPSAGSGDVNVQRTLRPTSVRAAPGGQERATLRPGTTVETIARDGGWARIRMEGWVPERDLMIADSSADAGLTAADLRAAPASHRGKVVRWEVRVIALQRADPLRRGLTLNEPYLLAHGPGDESAILYLAVPPSLLEQAKAIPALGEVMVTARVRDGRSPPVNVPVLDLIGLTRIP
jgi:hypothetical protein